MPLFPSRGHLDFRLFVSGPSARARCSRLSWKGARGLGKIAPPEGLPRPGVRFLPYRKRFGGNVNSERSSKKVIRPLSRSQPLLQIIVARLPPGTTLPGQRRGWPIPMSCEDYGRREPIRASPTAQGHLPLDRLRAPTIGNTVQYSYRSNGCYPGQFT